VGPDVGLGRRSAASPAERRSPRSPTAWPFASLATTMLASHPAVRRCPADRAAGAPGTLCDRPGTPRRLPGRGRPVIIRSWRRTARTSRR